MTDDQWRKGRDDDEEFGDDEFGAVRFADDDDQPSGTDADEGLNFGSANTGQMPPWTSSPQGASDDDLDVWSSFAGKAEDDDPFMDDDFAQPRQARIQIGTDPTDEGQRAAAPLYEDEPPPKQRSERPAPRPRQARPSGSRSGGGVGRDMPMAIGVGLVLGALFVGLEVFAPPWVVVAFAVLVVALGAVEFFDKITERGYQPVTVIGILAAAAGPAVAYWAGDGGIPLIIALAFMASALVFITSSGLHSGPLPNMAVTNLGIIYLGLLGAYSGLILKFSTVFVGLPDGTAHKNVGTDTLMMVAIGVVASDVGALFLGSAAGRTPLRAWISPNKTIEGFVGGLLFAIVAVSLASMVSDTWNGQVNVLVLGVGIGILAPIGDLTESMFKRNLDIKDFGTIVRGHGGILDRFDGFLFALPFAYYAMITLEPWTYVK